jgi:hypothetical protein
MSREEVIRTVGGPPGDYSGGEATRHGACIFDKHVRWLCTDGELLVRFDGTDSAADVWVLDVNSRPPPTLTERIRRWLGL